MQLYKRKDGRSPFWFVDVVDRATGRRIRKSTGETDRRKALAKAAEIAHQAANPERETTLAAALDAYVANMRADGRRSWQDARIKADKLVGVGGLERWGRRAHLDGSLPLSRLTATMVRDLKVARAAEGSAPGGIAAELRVLRAACRLAEGAGFRPAGVRSWGMPKTGTKLRYLSPDEARRVMARLHPDTPVKAGRHAKLVVPGGTTREARQDAHDLFLALVLTGGRWSEVGKLTWRQVDLGREVVTLYGWKTERERTVPLIPEVADMLRRRAQTARGAYVFPGKGGKARTAPSRAIQRAMDAEGLNDESTTAAFGRATTHSLRHTYASWLRQRGLGLDEIQPLLGHADIATTKIYAKVVDSATFERARRALTGARHTDDTPALSSPADPPTGVSASP